MAVTTGNVVSYEWAVSADGEDWSVVDTEDDATFGVTADLLGMYVKVTVIDDEANTVSDVTAEPVAENEDVGVIEIVSAEAVKANQIEVNLENPVITSDTTITLAKGTNTIDVTAKWADTFDSVTLTTPTNMTAGEYTVTLASKTDATNTDSADFEIEEGQKVTSIVILNETALTNKEKLAGDVAGETVHTEAYAYYDVLDQYGESMRTSTSIQWTGSADVKANKATGQLTLKKSDKKAWVYNDKIYLTGVYTKEGVVATAELTVGTEQALDTIEVAGFVKKNTAKLEKTLPEDFKEGEWFLLFNAFDQNGNPMEAGGIKDDDVNFISREPIIIEQVKGIAPTVTIDGTEYNAIGVKPGLKVADGGSVTIEAIATRTGNKTEYFCVVGVDQVITSFTMSAPAATVAEGDSNVEIPFVALDDEGNEVTNFVTIAKHQTFNALNLSVGGKGKLKLEEQADGSAKLLYSDDPALTWASSSATDGQQRPVSLTAVVVGGDSDNMMLGIDDRRRPEAIKDVNIASVYVEGDSITLGLNDNNFSFYDQYGSDMDALRNAGTITTYDNGFFGQATYGGSNDFNGWLFSVKATYTGNGGLYATADGKTTPVATKSELILPVPGAGIAALKSAGGNLAETSYVATNVVNNKTGENLKFEIVKAKKKDTANTFADFESTSRAKTKDFTVVDIKAIKNLTMSGPGTVYLGKGNTEATNASGAATTVLATADAKIAENALPSLKQDTPVAFTPVGGGNGIGQDDTIVDKYEEAAKVKVKGTYNGREVTIPTKYYTVAGSKVYSIHTTNTEEDVYLNKITPYNAVGATSGLSIQDLYDKTTSEGLSKNAKDTIKAKVYDLYIANTASTAAVGVINTASLDIELSDQDPKAASFSNFKEAYTLSPDTTKLGTPGVFTWLKLESNGFKEEWKPKTVEVKDQYGVTLRTAAGNANMIVSNVEENKSGYVENNFEFKNNNTTTLSVSGTERGDTFTLGLEYSGVTASSAITVGSDTKAYIDANGNTYITVLVKELEKQRKNVLGIA